MKLIGAKTPRFIKNLFSNYVWEIPNTENKIFLTFDDGPIPEITPWVLKELKKFNAKATFFCIGENIKNNKDIFLELVSNGHGIGNHTFNHLKGWKTHNSIYYENTQICQYEIENNNVKTHLFRPPYGKIKPSQSKFLRKLGYKIIMWDIISNDFEVTTTPSQCLDTVLNNVKPGSIIVFHDSKKAFKNIKFVLPKVLESLSNKGFIFEKIS